MTNKFIPAFILLSFMICVLITVVAVRVKSNIVDIEPWSETRTINFGTIGTTETTLTTSTTTTTTTTATTTTTTTTTIDTTTTTTTTTTITTITITTTQTTTNRIITQDSPEYDTYFNATSFASVIPARPDTPVPRTITSAPVFVCATQVEQKQTTATTTITTAPQVSNEYWHYVDTFKGTYYTPTRRQIPGATHGGSGNLLEDCGANNSYGIRGSIACKRIFVEYGYNLNGRTIVLIQSNSMPVLNGYYYVDDCCASMSVVDFYFDYASNCPFQFQGVVRDIQVSIMP